MISQTVVVLNLVVFVIINVMCCSVNRRSRRRVADSSSSVRETRSYTETQTEQREQRLSDTHTVIQPVTVYQQQEVTSRRREKPRRQQDDDTHDDDNVGRTARSEQVVASRAPREHITLVRHHDTRTHHS